MSPSALPSREVGHVHPAGESASVALAVWLEYTCPFRKRMYDHLIDEVVPAYGPSLKLIFQQAVQAWHPQSTMCHEAALAVSRLGGASAFYAFSTALFNEGAAYYDVNTIDLSRKQVYGKLAKLAAGLGIEGVTEVSHWVPGAVVLRMSPDIGFGFSRLIGSTCVNCFSPRLPCFSC